MVDNVHVVIELWRHQHRSRISLDPGTAVCDPTLRRKEISFAQSVRPITHSHLPDAKVPQRNVQLSIHTHILATKDCEDTLTYYSVAYDFKLCV